jgi:hypothetical protein
VIRLLKTTAVTLACLLAISCASRGDSSETTSGGGSATASSTATPGFDLVNFSGSTFRAVYLSPADSSGWEENVLGTNLLDDGSSVDIRFIANEMPAMWDLKVVATSGYYAEWKGLDLRGVSRVTLAITLIDKPTAVVELE